MRSALPSLLLILSSATLVSSMAIDILAGNQLEPVEPNYCNNSALLDDAGLSRSILGQFLGYDCSPEFYHCRWQSDGFRTYRKTCKTGLVYDTTGTANCNYDFNVKGCSMRASLGECNKTTEYTCALSEQCVSLNKRCDGHYDCTLEEDEQNCPMCAAGEFGCLVSEQCVSMDRRCNGIEECADGSDEHFCQECPGGGFFCPKSGVCLDASARCDGERQCPHGEDELLCRKQPAEQKYACQSGTQFIMLKEVCDNVANCHDGSDELYCDQMSLPTQPTQPPALPAPAVRPEVVPPVAPPLIIQPNTPIPFSSKPNSRPATAAVQPASPELVMPPFVQTTVDEEASEVVSEETVDIPSFPLLHLGGITLPPVVKPPSPPQIVRPLVVRPPAPPAFPPKTAVPTAGRPATARNGNGSNKNPSNVQGIVQPAPVQVPTAAVTTSAAATAVAATGSGVRPMPTRVPLPLVLRKLPTVRDLKSTTPRPPARILAPDGSEEEGVATPVTSTARPVVVMKNIVPSATSGRATRVPSTVTSLRPSARLASVQRHAQAARRRLLEKIGAELQRDKQGSSMAWSNELMGRLDELIQQEVAQAASSSTASPVWRASLSSIGKSSDRSSSSSRAAPTLAPSPPPSSHSATSKDEDDEMGQAIEPSVLLQSDTTSVEQRRPTVPYDLPRRRQQTIATPIKVIDPSVTTTTAGPDEEIVEEDDSSESVQEPKKHVYAVTSSVLPPKTTTPTTTPFTSTTIITTALSRAAPTSTTVVTPGKGRNARRTTKQSALEEDTYFEYDGSTA